MRTAWMLGPQCQLFHCYPGPHYFLRERPSSALVRKSSLLPCIHMRFSACLKIFRKNQSGNLPSSCNDREHSTLHLSRKLNKNQAVLTTPSICCTCEYHSASGGKASLLARGFLGEVGALAQITLFSLLSLPLLAVFFLLTELVLHQMLWERV